jgi:hypothetical protein
MLPAGGGLKYQENVPLLLAGAYVVLNKVRVGAAVIGAVAMVSTVVSAALAIVITVGVAGTAKVTRFCDSQEDLVIFRLPQTASQSVL